jgi:sugar phosphate isomerase/epimerase
MSVSIRLEARVSSATPSRRQFLTTAAALVTASCTRQPAPAPGSGDISTSLGAPLGLQLWSLREYLPKDLAGTLAKVRAMGFREVEGAGIWGRTAAEIRQAMDAAGLRCQSTHVGYERLRDDLHGAFAETRDFGATWIVCPWIPHEDRVTREITLAAADLFNRVGRAAAAEGLRFAYHCHGYEFVPSPEGTLFDTLAGATDPKQVEFQMDVFHAFYGGADPARLIEQHAPRVSSLHLKDLKKGAPVTAGTAVGTPDIDVPVGSGQLDMRAVLAAARKAGTAIYYLEDESADPLGNIPKSVAWLEGA